MNFLLCGDEKAPAVLLIHGAASSAELCYGSLGRALARKYRVIMACLDGHDPYSESAYESLDICCERIERYIFKRFGGRVRAISGFSLGGTVALELIKRGRIKTDLLHLDSPICLDPGLMKIPYTMIYSKVIDILQMGLRLPTILSDVIFGKGNMSFYDLLYESIDTADVSRSLTEAYGYKLSPRLTRFKGPVEYWCGSREEYSKKAARALEEYLPQMRVRVFKDIGKCQLLDKHKKFYYRELRRLLASGESKK